MTPRVEPVAEEAEPWATKDDFQALKKTNGICPPGF